MHFPSSSPEKLLSVKKSESIGNLNLSDSPEEASLDAAGATLWNLKSLPQRSIEDMSKIFGDISKPTQRVAFVGNYPPRRCGIATFTFDLRSAFALAHPNVSCPVLAMNDRLEGYAYDKDVRIEVAEQDIQQYHRMAEYINTHRIESVSLQHEYGIYGGDCGEHILTFLKEVRAPVVTTLHTILKDPSPQQRRIMMGILAMSSAVVTMTETGRTLLAEVYHADMTRVAVIPHGIPDVVEMSSPTVSTQWKKTLGLLLPHKAVTPKVVLTFGLLSPNKGIEYMIEALPSIVKKVPNVLYVVLGQTHPNLIREHGEVYRNSLMFKAEELGVAEHIKFVNEFVDMERLVKYLAAADVYVTPYLHEAQITSGTLSYAFGVGSAVVSTPYWHARDLIKDGLNGVLVPFRDSEALSKSIQSLLTDDKMRQSIRELAFKQGKGMRWRRVSEMYMNVMEECRKHPASPHNRTSWESTFQASLKVARPIIRDEHDTLPDFNLRHLLRMTDPSGLIQFANFVIPDFSSGYCTDDNARALTVVLKLRSLGGKHVTFGSSPFRPTGDLDGLGLTYLAFLQFAFERGPNRFRNFLSFEREWVDPEGVGSEESHARGLQAIGHCCSYGFNRDVAKRLFLDGIDAMYSFSAPRAFAHVLDGGYHYLKAFANDKPVVDLMRFMADRLLRQYKDVSSSHNNKHDENGEVWLWFENYLTYSNSSVSMSMLQAGIALGVQEYIDCGLESLKWLFEAQKYQVTHDRLVFSPIGCFAAQLRGDALKHPQHDQQPIEASTHVMACLVAYRHTEDAYWKNAARLALDWFLGHNCVGEPLYDSVTGGTRDGLHETGTNSNQGAESLLSFLLALADWREMERDEPSFL